MVLLGPLSPAWLQPELGMRPRRQVIETSDGYGIAGDPFTTTDRTLAEQVAAELDRTDPLPCPEHEWIEITEFGDPEQRLVCKWCSRTGLESELSGTDPRRFFVSES